MQFDTRPRWRELVRRAAGKLQPPECFWGTGGPVLSTLVLFAAVLLNATGMAAAGLAVWRDAARPAAVQQAVVYGDPTVFGEVGAFLLNLFLFILDVWRLAATE